MQKKKKKRNVSLIKSLLPELVYVKFSFSAPTETIATCVTQ